MVLPLPLKNAWSLGTPEARAGGGLLALIWADTVLPYSVNPPSVPTGDWWDQPLPLRGQFQGWVRNFAANSGNGARNYPNDREAGEDHPEQNRFFNCVIPFMLGLKESATAPKRMRDYKPLVPPKRGELPGQRNESDGPGTGEQWPFREEDQHAIHILEYYMENFVDLLSTAMIVALPVRDVMNFLGNPEGKSLFPEPDPAEGRVALQNYIRAALSKAKETGITILGWYLIDEPDFLLFNYWVNAAGVARLRALVRDTEHAWRMDLGAGDVPNDPEYRNLPPGAPTDHERRGRLRPCVTTFSRDFGEPFPTKPEEIPPMRLGHEPPSDYAAVRAADLYLFDWYPYRRSRIDVQNDWVPAPCGEAQDFSSVPHFTFADTFPRPLATDHLPMTTKVSIQRFQSLRRQLNATGNPDYPFWLLGDPDYVPVGLWSQAAGMQPPRDHAETEGDATMEPAPLFPPGHAEGEGCAVTDPDDPPIEPSFTRIKLIGTLEQVEYYAWAGLFTLSEVFACFTQPSIADNTLVANFVPVARELSYFQSLRWNNLDMTGQYVVSEIKDGRRVFPFIVQGELPSHEKAVPYVFVWLRFRDSPGPLGDFPTETLLDWLIVLNRESTPLSVKFDVNQASGTGPGHFPGGEWVLHEWQGLERLNEEDSIIPIRSSSLGRHVEFTVPPFRLRLFQKRRRKPTDPT